jgi:hypothetical protein
MIKLKKLLKENEEPQKLSPEVKKHFLEIVSTYNKYQEMMDRKSDLATIAETLGGITEAARTLALQEAGDWFDAQTVKRNMSELDKLGKQFDKVASEANALDQRMHGLYEDMGHILSRYYKLGEISEDVMKQRLGIKESSEDCGCNSVNESTPCWDGYKQVGTKMKDGKEVPNCVPTNESVQLKELKDLTEEETKIYKLGEEIERLMEKNCPTDPGKWSASKSAAKSKFDVYPSAYANGWAAKNYKSKGGGWRKCKD